MKGININCKHKDYLGLILSGEKTIETRDTKSLDPYIGKRIGLISTGRGKATLHGYATVIKRITYNTEEEWESDMNHHLVNYCDEYRWKPSTTVKYGYVLENVERCQPRWIETKGIVSREI